MELEVKNPFSSGVLKTLKFTDNITATFDSLKKRDTWPLHQRISAFKALIPALLKQRKNIIATAISEGGKPFKDTEIEFNRALNGVELCINEMMQTMDTIIPMGISEGSQSYSAFSQREPLGLVLAISAFNHPINLFVHQVLPSLASGCAVLYKPALTTPSVSKIWIDLLHEAGVPKNYLRYLLVPNEQIRDIVQNNNLHLINFIGSDKIGWQIRSWARPGTRVLLEHGGIAGAVLDQGSDTDLASSLVKSAFYHSGQVCISLQKLFIHESELEKWLEALRAEIKDWVSGNPMYPATKMGPMITREHVKRVDSLVADAIANGAELICGGHANGSFYEATILLNPSENAKIVQEEVFGPVLVIYTYSNWSDALKGLQSQEYEFQSSVYTQSLAKIQEAKEKVNCATLLINEHPAFRLDWMPFGGHRLSGLGMGGIKESMLASTKQKLIIEKHNNSL
jgi:acyl-CoA reductase-like NAD-dependent aldehyde dehydrogenase